jgi:hypothetical protein
VDVFGGVADIDAVLGVELHGAQGEAEWGRVGLFFWGITAADVGGEGAQETEVAELAQDAITVAAGD